MWVPCVQRSSSATNEVSPQVWARTAGSPSGGTLFYTHRHTRSQWRGSDAQWHQSRLSLHMWLITQATEEHSLLSLIWTVRRHKPGLTLQRIHWSAAWYVKVDYLSPLLGSPLADTIATASLTGVQVIYRAEKTNKLHTFELAWQDRVMTNKPLTVDGRFTWRVLIPEWDIDH